MASTNNTTTTDPTPLDDDISYDPPDLADTAIGDYIGDGVDVFAAAMADITAPFGEALLGLLFGGAVFVALYSAGDGDLATPSVVLTILGGLLVPLLPGGYVQTALAVMFLGLAGGLFVIGERYLMDPGVAS